MTTETENITGTLQETSLKEENADISGTENTSATQTQSRVFLSIEQAARILGKSLRAIERSIIGKWGNKLPDGWAARRMSTEQGWQWRVIPPIGFQFQPDAKLDPADWKMEEQDPAQLYVEGYKQAWLQKTGQQSVVIDRAEEVEYLLRELLNVQKQLSEERHSHMEDLRLISQMQGSMRLLENRASETARLKDDFKVAQEEMKLLKEQYVKLRDMPWWKRLFRSNY